jgi:cytochrome c-type biogenesis protein CcmF
VLACALVYGIYEHGQVLTPVGALLGVWIILSSLLEPVARWRRGVRVPRGMLGMSIAHSGLGVLVIALTTVQSFTLEHDVALAPGASTTVGNYLFRFDGVQPIEGPNYDGLGATVTVTRGGVPVSVFKPQKRQYWVQHQMTTETSIRMDHGNNILVALGEDLGGGRWSLRVQIRPLVSFIWLAALVMAIGGAVAASDRRYRTARITEAAVPAAPAGSAA